MSSGDPAAPSSSVRVLVEGEEVLFDHRETETGTGTVRLATGSPSEHNQVRKGRRRRGMDQDKRQINFQ